MSIIILLIYIYILFSGNALLDNLSIDELHKRFICECHFCVNDFVNPELKSRLKSTAVPFNYNQCDQYKQQIELPEIKTYGPQVTQKMHNPVEVSDESSESEEWVKKLTELPQSIPGPSNRCSSKQELLMKNKTIDKLKKKLSEKNKIIIAQRSKIFRLKHSLNKMKLAYKTKADLTNFNFAMEYSEALVRMQMKKKHRKWYSDEKKLSLILYYKSPSAFKYLRRMIVLPSVSTVKQWIGKSKFMPGLNTFFFSTSRFKNVYYVNSRQKSCN